MVNRFSIPIASFLTQLLPGHCVLCGCASGRPLDLCPDCEADLPWLQQACRRCALPLAHTDKQYCGRCQRSPPPFVRAEATWHYAAPVAQLIGGFKYHSHYSYGHVLAKLCPKKIVSTYYDRPVPDLIVPTPLHWWRQLGRGFNQSEQLARQLAAATDRPVCRAVLRHRRTPPQQGLNAQQRQKNLQSAFRTVLPVAGRSVALVDDVMTTGATASAISHCLLAAGATQVHLWCLARTPD